MAQDTAAGAMRVVLCWHMHQPDYRLQGRLLRPWTWLHAIKDYSDMAAHLEEIPGARAVVNFSPVLIRQLQDLPERIRALLASREPSGDAILDALAGCRAQGPQRQDLVRALLRVNEQHMKPRLPAYAHLFESARQALEAGSPLSDSDLGDLLVTYVLTWTGESLRSAPLPRRLLAREHNYSDDDRAELLAWLGDTIAGLLSRYRALADSGRAELSVTPWSHQILPLLLDHQCALDALPAAELPIQPYPGGAARCDWHLAEARTLFNEVFGHQPAGCWPSEGGLSADTVRKIADHGFRWTASGAQMLFNSIGGADGQPQLDRWKLPTDKDGRSGPLIFFRDDELSDRIGFQYARWNADEAVEDLVSRILQRRQDWRPASDSAEPVLAIIMDGENAWEYYPENGQAFLRALYSRLAAHPLVQLDTFTGALEAGAERTLPGMAAGSWVHGTFSTWIGDPAKNRAWELLAEAKGAVDRALEGLPDAGTPPGWARRILEQLAVCEASDWFWWLGPDNRLQDGPEFDRLFRLQLKALYRMLGLTPPSALDWPLDAVAGAVMEEPPAGSGHAGAMRPAQEADHA